MGRHKDWKKTPRYKERCRSYEAEVGVQSSGLGASGVGFRVYGLGFRV
jgi:hypothetical protein